MVSIAVEEQNEVLELRLEDVVDSVISKEVGELSSSDLEGVVSVESLESSMWCEVRDVA